MPGLTAGERIAGRFGPVQLVAVETAVLAVGAAVYALPTPGLVAVATAAAVTLAGALGRSGGRWWYEAAAARLRLRHRIRGLAEPEAGARTTPLVALAPDLTVRTVTDRRGPVGVGSDRSGWFAAVELVPEDGMSRADGAVLKLDWLARLAADASMPASAVQLLARYAPLVGAGTPGADSYRELLRTLGVPPHRDLWIALRLTHRAATAAAADRGGDLAGVHRALAAGLDRLGAGLSTAGHRYRVLDASSLRRALTVACGPDGREQWSSWQTAGAVHVCFAVRAWPAEVPPDLLDELGGAPGAAAVSVALTFRPPPDGHGSQVGVQALVRVAAAPDAIGSATAHLLATADRLGVRLVRLDGEQAVGVYATAPTGITIGLAPC